jgi:L-lactate dehydrogenase (cytochrome)
MTVITNINDLRTLAMKRVPRSIFDYTDRGSYDETTIKSNSADLRNMKLRQRVMINVDNRNHQSTFVGQAATMPVAIAPTGLAGIMHVNGEILGAQAAEEFGVPFTLSTMSICSIEQVREATTKPFWFQLYVMRDRGFVEELIQRAIDAKCSALVLTADLQIQGQRHQDIKNGLTVPPRLTVSNAINITSKPLWCLKMLTAKSKSFGNLSEYMPNGSGMGTLSQWIAGQFDASLNWNDVAWIRKKWPGKLILKGILDPEDAVLALKSGVDAIIVSNHGGRQLDGAPSAIEALPAIIDAVGSDVEILFDSGIRSGQDVLKALALGAKGTFIGKAFLYGLGAMGKPGVLKVLEIIKNELDVSMALTGTKNVSDIGPQVLWKK